MLALLTPAQRAEARENLRLAAPLIAAQLSFVGMHTLDTVMAGRLGPVALSSVAVGGNIWFMSFVVFMGAFMAVSPIVAHRVGAGRAPDGIGAFLRSALVLAVGLGLLWTALIQLLADPVIDLLSLEPATRAGAEAYLRVIALGAAPFCLSFVLRNGAEGHSIARAPLVAGVFGLVVNGVVNYLLMYGKLGLPALGVVGTAWGTVIAACSMVAAYAALYGLDSRLRALRLLRPHGAQQAYAWRELGEIARLGAPIAAILVAEAWLFNLGALLMARFGAATVAAHQIAINFASLTFMVPLAIGMATTVRVGTAAGAGDTRALALRGRTGIAMGAFFALFSAAAMALLPGPIVALYTDDAQIAQLAVRFLMLAAVFQLFDCVQATSNGALRGIKDTRWPMVVTVSAYWVVGMPVAAWLAFGTALGPAGVWCGFIAGLAVAALGLSLRFLRRTRRMPAVNGSVLMP